MDPARLLSIARGDAPADLLLRNCRIVNVFSGQIEAADIAIAGEVIAGIGDGYHSAQVIDLAGAHVAPGLIDAHVHIESALCTPGQFARAVVPLGVTTVVADPHEIANVAGAAGIDFMIAASRGLPLDVIFMAPSCVPASYLAAGGATLTAADLQALRRRHAAIHGLAEVMNYPGVIGGDEQVLAKIAAFAGRPIDGHAPGVSGNALNAYIAAGIGSDHECVTIEEARQKLARGLYILIREASNAHNLETLLPLITPQTNRRICFCTDDRTPGDLLASGGIDHMVRRAIDLGVDPVEAFRLATLNTAEWFGLGDRGAIAPGRRADLMVFDDLHAPRAGLVLSCGRVVARDSVLAADLPLEVAWSSQPPIIDWGRIDLRIAAKSSRVRVIGAVENQLVTRAITAQLPVRDGALQTDVQNDILKIAVIERHRGSGNVGLGFIQGFGLKRGAIAGTVAHDHHNLIVIGADDLSMLAAARSAAGGGLAVSDGEQLLAKLPLPVAGLMSDRPIEQVRDGYAALLSSAAQLGATMRDPFMAMSFMGLEVIPALKLTARGLVDVERFAHVELWC